MDILRQIVASPRSRHPEAGLDLCYVTDNIIATSGPSATYPQVAYRNPLKELVRFLDAKHAAHWAIWEFRAEGTGYPDAEVYGRIRHYPWPDHHPPPFALVPLIVASLRNWLKGDGGGEGEGEVVSGGEGQQQQKQQPQKQQQRVAVVHCKAGKGRSGTVTCSYLISEEGWTKEAAMKRFTERRMRPGFGPGVSIPSQVRYLDYVDRWTRHGKQYVERPVEVLEVHVWGLRDGVKVAVEGYVDEGKVIKTFHTFQKSERTVVKGRIMKGSGLADVALEVMGKKQKKTSDPEKQIKAAGEAAGDGAEDSSPGGDVVFRPSSRVVLPSSDVNLDFERRNVSKYGGFTVVTSVAHVWFNVFFEGNGPENNGKADESGVFNIDFDAMDGIKGSLRKGTRAFDRMSVVWKTVDVERDAGVIIKEPSLGEEVQQARAADWRGTDEKSQDFEKKLGLRAATSESASISRASSTRTSNKDSTSPAKDELDTVQSSGPDGRALNTALATDDLMHSTSDPEPSSAMSRSQTDGTMDSLDKGVRHLSTSDLPDGVPESSLKDHNEHLVGSVQRSKHGESSS